MKSNSAPRGLGFLGALTLLFIGLKLANVINWSWVWTLAPTWIPFAIYFLLVGILKAITALENRGTVACHKCKYRGHYSRSMLGSTWYCFKDHRDHPLDYRCREGEKMRSRTTSQRRSDIYD